MNVSTIPATPGARHRKKRVGRGIGSGHGKTSTRGQKGQRARTGSGKRPGFEGGRNPLIRSIPKRGFRQKATGRPLPTEVINLEELNKLTDGERLNPERLQALGFIRNAQHRIKLLGDGEIKKRLVLAVHAASASATAKFAKAGGKLELLKL